MKNLRTEIAAVVAGVAIIGGGIALELAGHQTPPEVWVAGTGSLMGGLGLALPNGSASLTTDLETALRGELAKVSGYIAHKVPATPVPQSAPAATASAPDGPAAVALVSPPVTAAPAPASSTPVSVGIPQ